MEAFPWRYAGTTELLLSHTEDFTTLISKLRELENVVGIKVSFGK